MNEPLTITTLADLPFWQWFVAETPAFWGDHIHERRIPMIWCGECEERTPYVRLAEGALTGPEFDGFYGAQDLRSRRWVTALDARSYTYPPCRIRVLTSEEVAEHPLLGAAPTTPEQEPQP